MNFFVTNDIDAFRRSVEAIGKGAEGFDAVKRLNALATLNLGETVSKIEQITDKGKRAQTIADVKKEWSALSAALGNPKLAAILENNNLSFAEQAAQIKALGLAAGGTAADNQAFTDRLTQQNEILNEGSIENMVAYIREMQTASDAIKETSSATGELIDRQKDVDGLFGGSQKILEVYAELRRQTEALRDAEQEVAMARERTKTLDPLTRERENIGLKIAHQQNQVAKAVRDQLDAQTVLDNLRKPGSQADEKALQNAIDRNAKAENAVALERQRLEVVKELADRELKINDLKREKQGVDLEQQRLDKIQQLVSLEEKKMGYVKEQAAAMENVLNARFERALLSSRSAGGFVDPRKEQQARIKLEEHLVKIRTAQINREFKMKMTQLDMEEKQLKLRNKLAKIEYDMAVAKDRTMEIKGMHDMFKAIDASIEETARLGRETAAITKNSALETVDLTLDKLKQAFEDTSFQGQMAQTFEQSFRDGLNNALSGLISGDMSFKEAMMSFINTIADAAIKRLQDMLVDSIMEAIFGPEEDIAEKMERILQEEQLSSKVGETIEEGGTRMADKLDEVLSQEIQTRVKVECCEGGSGSGGGGGEGLAKAGKTILSIAGVAGVGYLVMKGMKSGGGGKMEIKLPGKKIPTLGEQRSEVNWGGAKGTDGQVIDEVKVTAKKATMDLGERVVELFSGVTSGVGEFFEWVFGGFRMPQIGGDGYNYAGMSSESIDAQIDDIAGGVAGDDGIFGWIKNFFGKIGDGASNLFGWFKGLFGDKKDTDGMSLMQFAKNIFGSSEGEGTGLIGMFMKIGSFISNLFSQLTVILIRKQNFNYFSKLLINI